MPVQLSARENALISRGYLEQDVRKLICCSEEQFRCCTEEIFRKITADCMPENAPVCLFLGGQPGAGKSVFSQLLKKNYHNTSVVEIGLDNYRSWHPNYPNRETLIRNHWKDRAVQENDTPGNDIADFTHRFAGEVTDALIDMVAAASYPMVLEWGMRTPEGPSQTMMLMKQCGYHNVAYFVAVYRKVSMEACVIRADKMAECGHIMRRVPPSFHDLAVAMLPDSCDKIYRSAYRKHKVLDEIYVVDRNGAVIWKPEDEVLPGEVYRFFLDEPEPSTDFVNDPELTKRSCIIETMGFSAEYRKEEDGKELTL